MHYNDTSPLGRDICGVKTSTQPPTDCSLTSQVLDIALQQWGLLPESQDSYLDITWINQEYLQYIWFTLCVLLEGTVARAWPLKTYLKYKQLKQIKAIRSYCGLSRLSYRSCWQVDLKHKKHFQHSQTKRNLSGNTLLPPVFMHVYEMGAESF